MVMCQGGTLSRLTRKRNWKVLVMHEEIKRVPNFKNGHFRALERQKNRCGPLFKPAFWNFSFKGVFYDFLNKGCIGMSNDKVFRLGPAFKEGYAWKLNQ